MKKIELSIIIASYNTQQLLRQCLRSLLSASLQAQERHPEPDPPTSGEGEGSPAIKDSAYPKGILRPLTRGVQNDDYEIIVVDNASRDGSVEMVKKDFPQVKIIANQSNLGFAKANNQGIKIAQGEYILFLNSDTVVPPGTIETLLAYLKNHPLVGVVTPKLILKNGQIDPDCHRGFPTPWSALSYFLGLEKIFPKSKIFSQYHQGYQNSETIHEIHACCGAFLLTRRKILEKIGGWDEDYFFYGEDLDLCYRIKQLGFKVIYYPQVAATHYKGASSGIRRESRQISGADKKTRLNSVAASINAMEIFYKKFYQDKYPHPLTSLVILMIKIKGLLRKLKHSLIY